MRGGATRSFAVALVATGSLALGTGARAQQLQIDPKDRFAPRPDAPELDAAIQIDRWLEATAVKLDDGWAWPAVPDDWTGRAVPTDSLDSSLYSGSAGIVLFGIALAEATAHTGPDGSRTSGSPFLELPDRAAAHLIAMLPTNVEGEGCGLYTGIAGIGFALREWSEATHRVEGDRAARRCVELLGKAARVANTGIEWSDCTDVISGGAGVGLFLIYMAEVDRDPLARDLAIRAGRRLLDLSEREEVGRSWRMDPTFARVMPNFSHGTAGVAFFLARLYELTGDDAFLDGALDGAHHLLSIADTSNGGCRIYHHSNDSDAKDDADGRALHYLGWCHGPIGAAQLFMKLAQVTGDADWTDRVLQCANAVRSSGIPEQATPGLWNNVGLCCGTAGFTSFFEVLARARTGSFDPRTEVPPDDADRAFSRRCLEWTLAHGMRDEHGLRFPQAELRVKPEQVEAQVGLMQGAAGIGLMLLRLGSGRHGIANGLPDDPTSTSRGYRQRESLFPTAPAVAPNAMTTAFEELGRGVIFRARSGGTTDGPVRGPPIATFPCNAWLEAARTAGASCVLLHVDDLEESGRSDRITEFVAKARASGLAVGLSTALAVPMPKANSRERYAWFTSERSRIGALLTADGPLALLRVEVPADADDWTGDAGTELYRAAKIVAPHVPIEFVVSNESTLDRQRDADGLQRVGAFSNPHLEGREGDGRPRRIEPLWPTDVVADVDSGPDEIQGVAGRRLRGISPPEWNGPWRTARGRRHYVPLQIELPLGRFDRPVATPPGADRAPPYRDHRDLGKQLLDAASRARNVLVVVNLERDGSLSPDTIAQLLELGRR